MRICIPAENSNGLNSIVYGHFGSAPYFMIFDTDSGELEVINNMDEEHEHGHCNPLRSFSQKPIDIMITGGIGRRALEKLGASGVRAYRAGSESTVSEVLKSLAENLLEEISMDDACSHHHHGH